MPLALYRKYRPQTFSSIVGQEYLVTILQNSTKQNRFSHAYLLYGPRGVGKTTAARLIAKAANCLNEQHLREHGEPCNNCSVCKEISAGIAMDVVEIDAASNRGIDEIRSLRDNIKSSPSSYRKKVFIIDEVHMLTKEAFNALLKILEEPPEHAILVLATTDYEKLPATITSRTQKHRLRKLTVKEIFNKLKEIAQKEKIKISNDALELIAAASEGGLRDAESLLDQIASFSREITLKDVESVIGRTGLRKIITLSEFILNNDLQQALNYLHQLNEEGINMSNLNKELIHYLRQVISLKLNPELSHIFAKNYTKEEMESLKKHAQAAEIDKQTKLIKDLIQAYAESRYSPFPSVPLEIALIENLKN